MKSLAHGGNQNLFNILKEYGLENGSLVANYNRPCLKWYRAHHQAKMDGVVFTKAKPPKDWDEAIQQTQTTLIKGFNENFNYAQRVLTEKSSGLKDSVSKGEALSKLKESGSVAANQLSQKTTELKS